MMKFRSIAIGSMALVIFASAAIGISAHADCEPQFLGSILEKDPKGSPYIRQANLARRFKKFDFLIAAPLRKEFDRQREELKRRLTAEVLGGAVLFQNGWTSQPSTEILHFWTVFGVYSEELGRREHFLIRFDYRKSKDSILVTHAKVAGYNEVQNFSRIMSAIYRHQTAPTDYQAELRIRPVMGLNTLEISPGVADKIVNRHDVSVDDVVHALNSLERKGPFPFLDRGFMLDDRYVLSGPATNGERLRIGVSRELCGRRYVWHLMTAFRTSPN